VADVGDRYRSMLILPAPRDARSNRDRDCVEVELPPLPMRKQVAGAAEWYRTLEARHKGVRFRQAIRMVFPDKPFHPLWSVVCRPLVIWTFAKPRNACDGIHQIGNPMLEGRMREHHADESLRERLEGRFVRVRKIVRRHAPINRR
jgi:hypothetical protein